MARVALLAGLWIGLALSVGGCVETVRCPDGQIFDERGDCAAIPDGGPDGGAVDAGG